MNKSIIAVIVAMPLVLAGCSEPETTRHKAPAAGIEKLHLGKATLSNVNSEITLDGTVEAVNQAVVSAQTGGRVLALPFDVGDVVPKGKVIARITDSEQKASVNTAKAQLAEAKARFAEADQQLKRIKDVFERGVVSKAEYDQVKAAQKSAAARVESARAAVASAQQGLDYTTVIAPYSGILVRRLVDVGATVAPGTPLLEGVSLKDLRVQVDIPEQYIEALRQHKQARIILKKGVSIDASALRIPPSANASTHSFRTLLEVPEEKRQELMFPGTLVKVAFAIGSSKQILVPHDAVAKRGEITAVYLVRPGKQLEFRYIRPGRLLPDGQLVVLAGLEEGDQIALDPIAAAKVYKAQHFAAQE